NIFQLPYAVWELPLTQNWLFSNGLTLYKDVVYPHPPVTLYSIFALSRVFGSTPYLLRYLSFFLAIIFGYGVFLVGKQISEKVGQTSLVIFIITFFALLSDFNFEEMFAAIFTIYSTVFFLKFLKRQRLRDVFLCGLLVGLALLSKQGVIGIILAYVITLSFYLFRNKKKVKDFKSFVFKTCVDFACGVLLPALPFIVYFYLKSGFADFFYWNVIFNVTIYPAQSTPYALKDGLVLGAWLFLSLVPGLLLLFEKRKKEEQLLPILLMLCSVIFLIPVLLPSYLIFKIIALYPYAIILWALAWNDRKIRFIPFLLLVGSILVFFTVLKPYYLEYLPSNLFQNQFTYDTTNDDLQVANWLQTNTKPEQKIMNLGNHYIYTLSKRLPQNKYVYVLPWLVSPFDKTSQDIIKNPPKIVIVNRNMVKDDPAYLNWEWLSFLNSHYAVLQKFGDYEIKGL